jgi:hypothetical protein
MQELSTEQQKKLLKVADFLDKGAISILEQIEELETTLTERINNVRDGVDGYTPIKGVDYVDGKDGRTPIFIGSQTPLNPQKGDLWYQD